MKKLCGYLIVAVMLFAGGVLVGAADGFAASGHLPKHPGEKAQEHGGNHYYEIGEEPHPGKEGAVRKPEGGKEGKLQSAPADDAGKTPAPKQHGGRYYYETGEEPHPGTGAGGIPPAR